MQWHGLLDFNSTLVWLKENIATAATEAGKYFNSTLVWLKDMFQNDKGGHTMDFNSTLVWLKAEPTSRFEECIGISIPLWSD